MSGSFYASSGDERKEVSGLLATASSETGIKPARIRLPARTRRPGGKRYRPMAAGLPRRRRMAELT